MIKKIALGTVQFGLPYGVSNINGTVTFSEIEKILDYADSNGINTIDTAIGYGSSEQTLGKIGVNSFNIVSKTMGHRGKYAKSNVLRDIETSLEKLKVPSLEGFLLHNVKILNSKEKNQNYEALYEAKNQGLIKKIGYSIYGPNDLDNYYHEFKPDLIQLPCNAFDKRFFNSGWLKKLSQDSIEIHARSIFLQGLLLMDLEKIPKYFKKWLNKISDLHNLNKLNGFTKIEACIKHVAKHNEINKIVIGVESCKQLEEIIHNSDTKQGKKIYLDEMFSDDINLIDPSKWKEI